MKLTKQSIAALAVAVPTLASPVPGLLDPFKCWWNPVLVHLKNCDEARPFCSSVLPITTVTKSEEVTVTQPVTTTVAITTGTHVITPPAVTRYTTVTATYNVCKTKAAKRDYYPPPPYPTSTLPCGIPSAPSSQISEACSCLSLPTPTTTICNTATAHPTVTVSTPVEATITKDPVVIVSTVTVTYTPTGQPAPTPCGNAGIEWAVYNNPPGPEGWDFTPEKDKTIVPNHQGTDNNIATVSSDGSQPIIVHGVTTPIANFDMTHRFYLYATKGGTYTFKSYAVDDAAYLWVGDKAYSGWDKANFNSHATWSTVGGVGQATFSVCLEEGKYHPVRIMYGAAAGQSSFKFSVTGPDGTVLLGPDVKYAPIFFTHACLGAGNAPAFPPFGKET